jgi:hypothetical protein
MQDNLPTQEQLNAIIRFAAEHGRTWKAQLRDCWMTGNYVGFVGSNLLQQVRNRLGPSWLVKFNLKAAQAAQAAQQVEANKRDDQRDWETCHAILSPTQEQLTAGQITMKRLGYDARGQITMQLTRDEYTISLDAHFDLVMAGLPCEDSDCAAFEQEYNEAATEIAEERGVTISILNIRGCGYDSDRAAQADRDEESLELWQAIHDRI